MKLHKVTKGSDGQDRGHGKWYGDACAVAFALELIGERWSLLIVRELMLGGRRFSDIRASLPGISAKVLTERLEGLEAAGVLVKRRLPPPAAAQIYELTEWGYLAEPAIQELGRWAARSPAHDPTLPLSPVALMLSLRTLIDHEAARAFEARIAFAIGEDRFLARLENGTLPVVRDSGDGPPPDVTFHAPAATVLVAMFYGKVPIDELEANAGLRIEGDRQLAERLVGLIAPPPKCT